MLYYSVKKNVYSEISLLKYYTINASIISHSDCTMLPCRKFNLATLKRTSLSISVLSTIRFVSWAKFIQTLCNRMQWKNNKLYLPVLLIIEHICGVLNLIGSWFTAVLAIFALPCTNRGFNRQFYRFTKNRRYRLVQQFWY